MGGMVLETNINAILQAITDQERMHTESMKKAGPSANDSIDAISTKLGAGRNW
jgi:hypothetical protein